jgi:predicted PurR-regulated permease PerM
MPSGINSKSALRWTTVVLCAAAVYVCWPLWPALVLASWTAKLVHPVFARFERAFRGRRRAAALLVFLLFLVVVTPLVLIGVGVVVGVRDLLATLSGMGAEGVLEQIAVGSDGSNGLRMPRNLGEGVALVREYGSQGMGLLSNIAGAAAEGLIVVFVYFAAAFVFMLEGEAEWAWIERHSPLRPDQLDRFREAFHETGRGLLIGVGLTCAAQGLVATIAYVALGVPQGWVLGPVTGIASIIPVLGSAMIWVPVAVGLLLTEHPIKAAILAVVGTGVIGTIDNLLRPVFARMGALQMPMLLLFVSAFGGLMVLGAWGAIMGPLVVRLTIEALAMIKKDDGSTDGESS